MPTPLTSAARISTCTPFFKNQLSNENSPKKHQNHQNTQKHIQHTFILPHVLKGNREGVCIYSGPLSYRRAEKPTPIRYYPGNSMTSSGSKERVSGPASGYALSSNRNTAGLLLDYRTRVWNCLANELIGCLTRMMGMLIDSYDFELVKCARIVARC